MVGKSSPEHLPPGFRFHHTDEELSCIIFEIKPPRGLVLFQSSSKLMSISSILGNCLRKLNLEKRNGTSSPLVIGSTQMELGQIEQLCQVIGRPQAQIKPSIVDQNMLELKRLLCFIKEGPYDTSMDSDYPSRPFTRSQAKELKALQAIAKKSDAERSLHKHQYKLYSVWINGEEQEEEGPHQEALQNKHRSEIMAKEDFGRGSRRDPYRDPLPSKAEAYHDLDHDVI